MRSVVAVLLCVIVNVPDPTDVMRTFAVATAAFDVLGERKISELGPIFGAVTVVVVVFSVSVTDPTAFERPSNNSRIALTNRSGFVSESVGMEPAISTTPLAEIPVQYLKRMSTFPLPECGSPLSLTVC